MWNRLFRRSLPDPSGAASSIGNQPTIIDDGMRRFHSLSEFDDFFESIRTQGDDASRIALLSNSYLVDSSLIQMPDDPFSDEYGQAVLRVHAAVSGRQSYDASTMELLPELNVAAAVNLPAPYQNGGEWLGNYFESYGHVIKRLDVKAGMRVIEYGSGDAEISLHLARLGCDVTVVDIEPKYIEIVKEKATQQKLKITALNGSFTRTDGLSQFDRAFFYQSFHHSLEHRTVINNLGKMLTQDAVIVFGTEPIIEPTGPWRHAVPYPWGPRLDGLSLLAMRSNGWMELGFQTAYFETLLSNAGWTFDRYQSDTNGLVASVVSRRR